MPERRVFQTRQVAQTFQFQVFDETFS
jgi:hypothetical protein